MSRKVFAILTGIAVGAAAIVGGTYVGLSMERVDQGEVGVVYTMKDGVKKETLQPGHHWVGPFAKVKNYPVAQQQLVILSILVYTFFSRMFDLMLPPVAKHSIVVA